MESVLTDQVSPHRTQLIPHWERSGPTVQVQEPGLIQQTEGMYTLEHSVTRDNGIT
jgi:hypothetical protein